jgi:flagella basal body P-ring formation protein FlgA
MAMRAVLLLLLFAATPARADLATLRPFAVVDDATVRLGDLFEGAGPRAGAVLGPAPAPGARQVVEAGQLLAIARSHGIAWRPMGAAERVVIERPGRAVPLAEVVALLRATLRHQGLEEEAELEFAGFTPPLVPQAAFAQLTLEGAALDATASRFAATLVVAAEGMPTQRLRVTGRIVPTVPALVTTRRMAAGEVVGTADVRPVRLPAARLRPGAAQRPEQVVGQALRRPAAAEQPLLLADLAQPLAVERGAAVTMLFETPAMTLTAQGRAMEGAPRGATVPVMNLQSRVVVEAQVIGPGRVRVGPGR